MGKKIPHQINSARFRIPVDTDSVKRLPYRFPRQKCFNRAPHVFFDDKIGRRAWGHNQQIIRVEIFTIV